MMQGLAEHGKERVAGRVGDPVDVPRNMTGNLTGSLTGHVFASMGGSADAGGATGAGTYDGQCSRNYWAGPCSTSGDSVLNELHHHYGGFSRAIPTLFRGLMGGDFTQFVTPLVTVSPWYGAIWLLYIAFMALGVMNLIMGFFVDFALKAAEVDHLHE